jgi:hypothetical protein
MTEQFEEFQKVSKESFDAAVHAYGEANKGFQAISAELATYFKKLSRTQRVPLSN